MGALDKIVNWFRPKKEMGQTLRKAVQGDPADYERYDVHEADSMRSNRVNPGTEMTDFLQLYHVNPHVYSCVSAISTAMASLEWQILKNGVEVDPDHAFMKKLAAPNPDQVWYDFSEGTNGYLELCGNAFWEEVRDPATYDLIALYLLRPDKMKIIPHPKVKVAGYIYEPRPGTEIIFGRDEITHFKYYSPLDEYWGISPSYAAQNSIILDIYSTSYNKKFFQNSAVPEGVLETEGNISDQTFQRLKQDWAKKHRGLDKTFEVAILEEGLHYKPIGFNQRDMQMIELKRAAKEDIYTCFRVPPSLIGTSGRAGASPNLREDKKMFWMDNIIPKARRQQQVINKHIIPKGQGLELRFMIEKIQSLIEDIQVATAIAMQLVTHGIMTIDEVREKLFGMKKVQWGAKPWIPTGLQQYGEEPPAGLPAPGGAPPQSNNEAQNEKTPLGGSLPAPKPTPQNSPERTEKRWVDFEKISRPEPNWTDKQAVRDWRAWKIWKGIADPEYVEIRNLMKSFFSEQFSRVTSGLRGKWKVDPEKAKLKKNRSQVMAEEAWTNPYLELHKANEHHIEEMMFDIKNESGKLKLKLEPKAKKVIKKYGSKIIGDVKSKADFDVANPRVVKFLKENAGSQIDGITKKTRQLMGRELSKAYANGEDFDEMMVRLNNVFKGDLSDWRARTIARTEVVTLTQFAALEGARQSGVVKKKRWVSELLDSTRDKENGEDHRSLHDLTVDLDDLFPAPARGGEINLMDGPGDPNADAENLVNCLCILDFPGTTEELEDIEGDVKKAEQEAVENLFKKSMIEADTTDVFGDLANALKKRRQMNGGAK